MHSKWRFLGDFPYFHAMLYAKMFHGYDILKHFETCSWGLCLGFLLRTFVLWHGEKSKAKLYNLNVALSIIVLPQRP